MSYGTCTKLPQPHTLAECLQADIDAAKAEPERTLTEVYDYLRLRLMTPDPDAYLGADDPDLTDEDSLCRDDQYYAQAELESEANAAYDDQQERYAREALDPEYEAFCDDQQDEDDPSWSDQAAEDEFIDSAMEYLTEQNPEVPF